MQTDMKLRVLVTGGAGFIGSHLIKRIVDETNWEVVCVDRLSYASNGWERLKYFGLYNHPRVHAVTWDLSCLLSEGLIKELGDINIIIHMAADTHVDRSITNSVDCIKNNVMCTLHMLEYARTLKNLKLFMNFSTDECYGVAPPGVSYTEEDRHNPSNPYSASKCCAENIAKAYSNTYNVPIIITNMMNAYGPLQCGEKVTGLVINKVLHGETVIIHTNDQDIPGSRYYIHVEHVTDAVLFILKKGSVGETYNITGQGEVDNMTWCQEIAKVLNMELKYHLTSCHEARPGHDDRYSLDGSKLAKLGWAPPGMDDLLKRLGDTVRWYLDNKDWLSV